jgi:hypothetical protein
MQARRDTVRRIATGTSQGAVSVFLVLLVCYGYFPPTLGRSDWAPSARADLTWAVVDQGVLQIDRYHENTGDKAYFRGHYYFPGSIGPSLLALPPYLAFQTLARWAPLHRAVTARPGRWEHVALAVMTFFAVSVPAAALGVLVYLLTARFVPHRQAVLVALIYGLGTIAFPYSKALFQHQIAAFGMFAGFFLLWKVVREEASYGWLWLAGLLFGLSTVSEYPVAPFIAILLLWAVLESRDDWSILGRVAAGGLPPLVLFGLYNAAIFGTPLPVGYRYHVEYHDMHARGFMGFTGPSWPAFVGITVSPYRGLFFLSPILLLAVPGLIAMARDPRYRKLAITLAVILTGFLVYNASYLFWWGGRTVGPRFLVPALPFAAIPLAFALRDWLARPLSRWAAYGLIALSVGNVWAQTVAGRGYAPETLGGVDVTNPLAQYSLPALWRGDVAANYGMALGLEGIWSLLPLAVVVLALIYAGLLQRPTAETSTLA